MLFTCFNGIQPVKTASLSSQVLFGINRRNKTEAKSAVFSANLVLLQPGRPQSRVNSLLIAKMANKMAVANVILNKKYLW